MLRRGFLTLMAGMPLAGLVPKPALTCSSYLPTANAAMRIFVRAVLTNDPNGLFVVISQDKPFVIQHGMAEVTGEPASGVEYSTDMVTADFQKRDGLYAELMVRRPGTNDGLAYIVAATGGKDWTEAGPGRFVPPGEKAESPVFVVFRAEWDGWFIDTIGLPAAQAA